MRQKHSERSSERIIKDIKRLSIAHGQARY